MRHLLNSILFVVKREEKIGTKIISCQKVSDTQKNEFQRCFCAIEHLPIVATLYIVPMTAISKIVPILSKNKRFGIK